MSSINEVTLYNLANAAAAGSHHAKANEQFFVHQMVLHLRHEHNMHLHTIAKRLGIKIKEVKKIIES